jgi:hypothetical protein
VKTADIVSERGEFATLEDGYVYFWPHMAAVRHADGSYTGGGGAIAAHELRAIADELDRRNAKWDAEVRADLGYQLGGEGY